ncbi:MAG: flagellar hook-basal body complex protein FliE [Aeromonadaceae bacterium]
MKIEAMQSQALLLQKMNQMAQLASSEVAIAPASDANGSFGQLLTQTVRQVDGQQHIASSLMAAVDSGQSDDLVGAMVASQKASLSFSTLMQVRNKLMSGLDDIMRMPL